MVAAYPVRAEVLVFTCTMSQTWKDCTALPAKARIEITPETLGYVEYHEVGGKLQLAGRGTLERLEPTRVTISDDAENVGYIDRTTGEEYWKDRRRGAEEHGVCTEVH